MSIQSVNPNLPKLRIPSLFDSSQNPNQRTPSPLKFTTESSLEETNKLSTQKNVIDKKPKQFRTSENWYG